MPCGLLFAVMSPVVLNDYGKEGVNEVVGPVGRFQVYGLAVECGLVWK